MVFGLSRFGSVILFVLWTASLVTGTGSNAGENLCDSGQIVLFFDDQRNAFRFTEFPGVSFVNERGCQEKDSCEYSLIYDDIAAERVIQTDIKVLDPCTSFTRQVRDTKNQNYQNSSYLTVAFFERVQTTKYRLEIGDWWLVMTRDIFHNGSKSLPAGLGEGSISSSVSFLPNVATLSITVGNNH